VGDDERRFPAPRAGSVGRVPIRIAEPKIVKSSLLPDLRLPLVVEPAVSGVGVAQWAEDNRSWIDGQLRKFGAILFRGFPIDSLDEFQKLIVSTAEGDLLEYSYASTPRSVVRGGIYTSTEYPADQVIPLHNEMSYARNWPLKAWFYCDQPAEDGGETPLADSRRVFQGIPAEIRGRFTEKGVLYVRNYGGSLDLDWRKVFGTPHKTEVEDYCRRAGIEFEWRGGDRLRTRQRCQAIATHPRTNDTVWFNQAHLFHISSLDPAARALLLSEFAEADVPRNAYYGDASPIEAEVLDKIRDVYHRETQRFIWRRADVLMLDNMLVAHGRAPFRGPRRILVGLAEPFTRELR
jgi:alpha-ketoglutarate-dependent taurine dioxygenase